MNKVGLVCEGGGTKGAYTAGVLACFLDHDIQFPYCVGISSGTLNLMGYVSKDKHFLETLAIDVTTDKKIIGIYPLLHEKQIYGLERVFTLMNEHSPFDFQNAMNNHMECETGVYNFNTGEVEYYTKDYLASLDLAKASCALLLLTKPIKMFDSLYMDAGLTVMIPIERSIAIGNEKHIFISTKENNYVRKKAPFYQVLLAKLVYGKKYPFIPQQLADRHINYQKQWGIVSELEQQKKALILRPSKNLRISRSTQDKEKLKDWYQLGYDDTLNRLQEIKNFINK